MTAGQRLELGLQGGDAPGPAGIQASALQMKRGRTAVAPPQLTALGDGGLRTQKHRVLRQHQPKPALRPPVRLSLVSPMPFALCGFSRARISPASLSLTCLLFASQVSFCV